MDFLEGKAARKVVNGILVSKGAISKAGATTKSLFTVVGGRVILKGLVAEVSTVFAAGANNTNFDHTPTGGVAVDLCGVLDSASSAVGTLFSMSGLPATAMTAAIGAVVGQTYDVILKPGVVGFKTAGNTTGAITAELLYIPLDDGAYVEAA